MCIRDSLSPPDNNESFLTFLPLGCTDISMPVSKIFVLSVKESDPLPPGNNVSNISEKCTDIELNDDSILNSISVSTSLMFNNNSFFESCKSQW